MSKKKVTRPVTRPAHPATRIIEQADRAARDLQEELGATPEELVEEISNERDGQATVGSEASMERMSTVPGLEEFNLPQLKELGEDVGRMEMEQGTLPAMKLSVALMLAEIDRLETDADTAVAAWSLIKRILTEERVILRDLQQLAKLIGRPEDAK